MNWLDRLAAHFGYHPKPLEVVIPSNAWVDGDPSEMGEMGLRFRDEVARRRYDQMMPHLAHLADILGEQIPAKQMERVNNGTDAVARGQRWEAFYEEEGGIREMIAALRHDYFTKVGQLSPGDTQKLLALGMADKIAVEIERKIQTVIETGKIRANDRAHAGKIAGIGR